MLMSRLERLWKATDKGGLQQFLMHNYTGKHHVIVLDLSASVPSMLPIVLQMKDPFAQLCYYHQCNL